MDIVTGIQLYKKKQEPKIELIRAEDLLHRVKKKTKQTDAKYLSVNSGKQCWEEKEAIKIKIKKMFKKAGMQMLKAQRLTFIVKLCVTLRTAQTRICEEQHNIKETWSQKAEMQQKWPGSKNGK